MASKTLGQVAQQRWREARDAGLLQDDAWQAAAEAAVRFHHREVLETFDAREAVIEAAKALAAWGDFTPQHALMQLHAAVEALQGVEDE